MNANSLGADELLTTTRAVRKRLDFDKAVAYAAGLTVGEKNRKVRRRLTAIPNL